MRIIFFIIVLLFPIYCLADMSQLSGNYTYLQSSDQMFMHSSSMAFRNNRRDLSFPYENEDEVAWDVGGSLLTTQGFNAIHNYNGQRGNFLLGRKFSSNFQIDITSGAHRAYDTNNNNDKTIYSGEIKLFLHSDELFDLILSANRDYAYIYTIQPGGTNDRLTTNVLNFSFNYNFLPYLMTRMNENYFFISDQNAKSVSTVSLLYGIATDEPWIWVGIGYDNTSYKYNTTNYWSPSAFMGFGFRSEANVPIYVIDNVYLNLEFNYNRLWDKDTCTRGNGVAFASKLQFGKRDNHNIAFFYNRINSIEDGNLWFSNEMGMTFNLMF
nr:hypothetical protein GTC16762_21440 [Pigmentibacter ruber]